MTARWHHTENFFCLSGRVWLYANGSEVLLTPGDFVHAPAGTIHTFAIERHDTKLLGILTSDIFEPFFDVTGEPTDDVIYTEGLIQPERFRERLIASAPTSTSTSSSPVRRPHAAARWTCERPRPPRKAVIAPCQLCWRRAR